MERWPSDRTLQVTLVVAGGLFLALLVAVAAHGPVEALDQAVFEGLQHLPDGVHALAHGPLAWPGDEPVLLAVMVLGAVACLRLGRPLGVLVLGAGGTGYLAVLLLKEIIGRARPSELIATPSFPSGHAAGATIVYGLVTLLVLEAWQARRGAPETAAPGSKARVRAVLAGCVAVVLLTGTARTVGNVHWASDVLAGWAWGTFVVAGCLLGMRAWQRRAQRAAVPAEATPTEPVDDRAAEPAALARRP